LVAIIFDNKKILLGLGGSAFVRPHPLSPSPFHGEGFTLKGNKRGRGKEIHGLIIDVDHMEHTDACECGCEFA
jgi:hypothetical protein